jgi:adenylate cyclase
MILLGGVLLATLALGMWYFRREAARLRGLLAGATSRLQRLQVSFAQFAPPDIVERIIDGGIPTRGERMEVTVLFADLVGFTSLAESMDPSKLVEVVNGYFEHMNHAITQHRGHVATFIGDGMLAFFGAFEPNPWQGNDGVYAALEMREELAKYNRELESRGFPTLAFGVGLHRGTGIAGLVGSSQKKEFTLVGRTINVAARVQALTRDHGVDVLLTEDLQRTLDPRFQLEALGPAPLRGIEHPVGLFSVVGFADQDPAA